MENKILSESDLEGIFAKKKKRKVNPFSLYFFPVIIFLGVFAALFIILNFSAFEKSLSYWYQNEIENGKPNVSEAVVIVNDNSNVTKVKVPSMQNNTLRIDAINLVAPITWRIANQSDSVSAGLQNGLIQIDGTALPGEIGNVFITGHSSNYAWAKGDYNSVFSLLDKLVSGDSVALRYQDKNFVYVVKEKKVVASDEISVMNPTKQPVLTLMTCWPIGTSLKRLVVIANQVSPDPSKNQSQSNSTNNSKLPAVH